MKSLVTLFLFLSATYGFGQVVYGDYKLDPENRTEVVDNEKPYQYVCHLFVKRRWGGAFPSTGFYIGENKIVTAGHSVGEYRPILKNKIRSVEIRLFEYFDDEKDYRVTARMSIPRSEIEVIKAHPKFKGKGMKSRVYDYGVIKLKSDTLSKVLNDSYVIGEFNDFGNPDDEIHITGYPGDRQWIKEGSLWDKHDLKKNITDSKNYLTYGIYTYKGDSGAPIWLEKNGKFYVIGIHNTGYTTCNGGVKVNQEVLDFINGI